MGSFTNIVTIERPIQEVFAYLADFEHVPEWNYAIAETRQATPGPVGVGTTYVQRREIPEPAEERFTVTELTPDQHVAVEGTIGPFPAQVAYDLEPADEGTVVTNTVDLQVTGAKKLLGGASRVKAAVAANLDTLKRLLELED